MELSELTARADKMWKDANDLAREIDNATWGDPAGAVATHCRDAWAHITSAARLACNAMISLKAAHANNEAEKRATEQSIYREIRDDQDAGREYDKYQHREDIEAIRQQEE